MNPIESKIRIWLGMDGTSKTRLASELGISTKTLRDRMAHPDKWSLGTVKKLAEILGCNVTDLI